MTKKINAKLFPFSFFLSDRVHVSDLDSAAIKHGGATKNHVTNEAWSNIAKTDYITINESNNTIAIFIPDTFDVSNSASDLQRTVLRHISNRIESRYDADNIAYDSALGTWYSDDQQKVIYDNVIIASVSLNKLTHKDIAFFIKLASHVKKVMKQEAVSIMINDSLALI